MSPVVTIARHELGEALGSWRLVACGAACSGLLLIALGTGLVQQHEAAAEEALARASDWETWLAQGEKDPHSAAHYGVYATRPGTRLSALDPGVEAHAGRSVWLEAHNQNLAQDRPAEDNVALPRLGRLTAASVVQVLLPLLIAFVGFDALVGERERGTLRQLASLGLSTVTLARGKALGMTLALGLVLVPASLLAAGATLSGSATPADIATRLGLLALTYLLYLGGFVALTLAVSAWASSSRTSLVVLLGFWIGGVLIVPRVAADLSEHVAPAPSATAFWSPLRTTLAAGLGSHDPNDPAVVRFEREVLARYGVTRRADLPVNMAGLELQAGEDASNAVYDRHFGELWRAYERQRSWQLAASLLAPSIAARSASMAFAGTDVDHHVHFVTAAETHRRRLQRFLNADLASHPEPDYVAGEALWQNAPRFEYRQPSAGWALGRHWTALTLLVAWLLGSVALCARATARMRVL